MESINSTLNLGDLIVTFISLGFIVVILVGIAVIVAAKSKRKQQLDGIEKKIDDSSNR